VEKLLVLGASYAVAEQLNLNGKGTSKPNQEIEESPKKGEKTRSKKTRHCTKTKKPT